MEHNSRSRSEASFANRKVISFIKCLLIAYALTGVMLLLLAFLLYRFNLSESIVSAGIIGIYAISSFVAGLLAGKSLVNRKFIWGLLEGILYFAILLFMSIISNRSMSNMTEQMLTAFLICGASGMLGGMLS